MKKKDLIFYAELVACGFFCFFLFRMAGFLGGNSLVWDAILLSMSGAAFFVFEFWNGKIEEDENPLSIKKVAFVLKNVADKRTGLRSEFVEEFGIDMYNLFLERGYIHELFSADSDNHEWQVTKLGLRRKVELCS